MKTYLLAWNPLKYLWGSLEDELEEVRGDGSSWVRWSVNNNRSIQPGDRLFLIRLGQNPRGIVGSGWAKSTPYSAPHWDPVRKKDGTVTNYVDLAFDALFKEPRLPMDQLLQSDVLCNHHWSIQGSGVRIPEDIAVELEGCWSSAIGTRGLGFPDEMASPTEFREGAAMQVYVNKYERNPAAREACLRRYGRTCAICGMTFGNRYGAIAASFIQVHHLSPLGDHTGRRPVDPVTDMRPICPNCHAVVHLKKPPLTIEQAKDLLMSANEGTNQRFRCDGG